MKKLIFVSTVNYESVSEIYDFVKYIYEGGDIAVATALLYPGCSSDMEINRALLERCDEVYILSDKTDLAVEETIEIAKEKNMPIKLFKLGFYREGKSYEDDNI